MKSALDYVAYARQMAQELDPAPEDSERLTLLVLAQMCVILDARSSRGYARLAPLRPPMKPPKPAPRDMP